MKNILLSLFVIGFGLVAGANGTFIGNPGQGIDIDGQLYLLDLFSIGAHKNPKIGWNQDPALPKLPNFEFSYPRNLLAEKLSELNAMPGGLGDFLLIAMKEHAWVMVDYPLTLIENPDDPIELPQNARIVQLANRLPNIIRIHRQSWDRLDDANKVALLIHEALASLAIPRPGIALSIRNFVGKLFLYDQNFSLFKFLSDVSKRPRDFGFAIPSQDELQGGLKQLRGAMMLRQRWVVDPIGQSKKEGPFYDNFLVKQGEADSSHYEIACSKAFLENNFAPALFFISYFVIRTQPVATLVNANEIGDVGTYLQISMRVSETLFADSRTYWVDRDGYAIGQLNRCGEDYDKIVKDLSDRFFP